MAKKELTVNHASVYSSVCGKHGYLHPFSNVLKQFNKSGQKPELSLISMSKAFP